MTSADALQQAQGGGYPPGGYGGGPPPGGYGPPGGPGGYGPPGPGGYGPPPAGSPPGGYGPPGAPGGYGPPAPPYGSPYPPPQGGPPWGAPGGGPPNPEFKKNAQLWLVIAAASSILCTCLFGVIGAVFCYMAMQANDQGNTADAANKLKWGKIITVVGLVFGVVLTIFSIVYAARFTQSLTGMMTGGS